MKSAFVVVAVLALAGSAFASGCASTPQYTTYLKLACTGKELSFNWPDYTDAGKFYACQGVGRPLLLSCSAGTYFSYVLQACEDCSKYIPSQRCDTLKIEKGSSCQPIDGSSTEHTPTYPTDPTQKPTKTPKPTTSKIPTTKTTSTPPGPATTAFPLAPSPSTVDPNVPIPPTAAPTPPPVEAKPPSIDFPNMMS